VPRGLISSWLNGQRFSVRFLPLCVFCGDHLLAAYLRPSNIDPAKHARAILKLLVQRIRRDWPRTRILFRADSGFCRWKLLRWCDRHHVGYVVGLAGGYMKTVEDAYPRTGRKRRSERPGCPRATTDLI
jgi:hypothetical protein